MSGQFGEYCGEVVRFIREKERANVAATLRSAGFSSSSFGFRFASLY